MSARIRLVRHATLQLELDGRRMLVDPMLDPARARPPVPGTPNARRNPLVELPQPAGELVDWAQAVLVTHLHADHLDEEAQRLIGGRLRVFCRPADVPVLRERGLTELIPVDGRVAWEGLEIARTDGRHGTGELAHRL